MMKKTVVAATAAVLLASAAAYAQMHQHGSGTMQEKMQEKMQGHMHGQMHHGGAHNHAASSQKGDTGPSSQAFRAINDQMHSAMDITYTGNADRDFVAGMIPHHEGAVAMAKVALAFGKDPEIRKLAEDVVRAQESEIAFMKAWLARETR